MAGGKGIHVPFLFEVTYNGATYHPVFVGDTGGYRDIQGFPCENVEEVEEGKRFYLPPIPGVYRFRYDKNSVDVYWSHWEYCDVTYKFRPSEWNACMHDMKRDYPFKSYIDIDGLPFGDDFYKRSTPIAVIGVDEDENPTHLVPGVSIEVIDEPRDHHVFEVYIGGAWIDSENKYVSFLDFGCVPQGETSTNTQLGAWGDGSLRLTVTVGRGEGG